MRDVQSSRSSDLRRYLPKSGRLTAGVVLWCIILLIVLVAILLWVSAEPPPTNPFAGQRTR